MSQRVCFMEIEMIKGGNVYTFIRLKEEPMTEFEKLVSEQMKTMDKLASRSPIRARPLQTN